MATRLFVPFSDAPRDCNRYCRIAYRGRATILKACCAIAAIDHPKRSLVIQPVLVLAIHVDFRHPSRLAAQFGARRSNRYLRVASNAGRARALAGSPDKELTVQIVRLPVWKGRVYCC